MGAGGCPLPPRRRPLPTPMIEQKIVLTVISSHLINCMVAKIRMCSISFLDHSTLHEISYNVHIFFSEKDILVKRRPIRFILDLIEFFSTRIM